MTLREKAETLAGWLVLTGLLVSALLVVTWAVIFERFSVPAAIGLLVAVSLFVLLRVL